MRLLLRLVLTKKLKHEEDEWAAFGLDVAFFVAIRGLGPRNTRGMLYWLYAHGASA
jgi:hypothetical protein